MNKKLIHKIITGTLFFLIWGSKLLMCILLIIYLFKNITEQ